MKILIDTNVLISAALFPGSTPFRAYVKAASWPYHGMVCDQNIDEMKKIWVRKFPDKEAVLDKFLANALLSLELISVPTDEIEGERCIRDTGDQPILRAAIKEDVDMILTGDKDFLEARLAKPKAVSPAQFLNLNSSDE